MDWKSYEEITKDIYETLGKEIGVKIECFGNNCKLTGKSGVDHQIDVLTSHSDGLHNYKTIIECKYWNKTINKDIVMKLMAIMTDVDANKAVLVSKLGFTPDAIQTARHNNVGLIELREPTEDDWKEILIPLNIKKEIPRVQLTSIEMHCNSKDLEYLQSFKAIVGVDFKEFKYEGNSVLFKDFFDNYLDEIYNKKDVGEFEKDFEFNNAFIIYDKTKEEIPFVGFRLKAKFFFELLELNAVGKENVFMILKSHFDNKIIKVFGNGNIKEHKKT